jgi:lysophospholipase L1-like esterase
MLDRFEEHFRRAIRRAQAHADRVLVVRQSWFDKDLNAEELRHMWHGGVGQAWREEVTTYYSIDVTHRLMAILDQRAARVAEQCGVEQLDLRPILDPNLNNYYDYFHLTPTGARIVAEAVASMLTRQRAIDAAPRPIVYWPRAGLRAS